MFARILESRPANALGFALCVALLSYAYYAQFALELAPCPLCIFQRIALIALGLVFLAGLILGGGRHRSRIVAGLTGVSAATGAGIAGWHLYQQSLPSPEYASCGGDLGYMFDTFSTWDALQMAFTGSGDCTTIDWSFLGLTMPAWVAIWFVALGIFGVWANLRAARPPF